MSRKQRLKVRISNLGRGSGIFGAVLLIAALIAGHGATGGDFDSISIDIDLLDMSDNKTEADNPNATSENTTGNVSDATEVAPNATRVNASVSGNSSNSSDEANATG